MSFLCITATIMRSGKCRVAKDSEMGAGTGGVKTQEGF